MQRGRLQMRMRVAVLGRVSCLRAALLVLRMSVEELVVGVGEVRRSCRAVLAPGARVLRVVAGGWLCVVGRCDLLRRGRQWQIL